MRKIESEMGRNQWPASNSGEHGGACRVPDALAELPALPFRRLTKAASRAAKRGRIQPLHFITLPFLRTAAIAVTNFNPHQTNITVYSHLCWRIYCRFQISGRKNRSHIFCKNFVVIQSIILNLKF